MSAEPELRDIDETEALNLGVQVSKRWLRSQGVGHITDEQVETAYKAGADRIDRYFVGLGNRNGTILSGRGFGNSSMAHQCARDMNIATLRVKNELRLELEGFQNEHNAEVQPREPKKPSPSGKEDDLLEQPQYEGYRPASWLEFQHGIRRNRLSEAAKAHKVRTKPAPSGLLDSDGRGIRTLYHLGDAQKHCAPKSLQGGLPDQR